MNFQRVYYLAFYLFVFFRSKLLKDQAGIPLGHCSHGRMESYSELLLKVLHNQDFWYLLAQERIQFLMKLLFRVKTVLIKIIILGCPNAFLIMNHIGKAAG